MSGEGNGAAFILPGYPVSNYRMPSTRQLDAAIAIESLSRDVLRRHTVGLFPTKTASCVLLCGAPILKDVVLDLGVSMLTVNPVYPLPVREQPGFGELDCQLQLCLINSPERHIFF